MKNDAMRSIITIEAEELNKLVSEVKETVATDVLKNVHDEQPVFQTIDLWNIRRNRKFKFGPNTRSYPEVY